MGHHDFNMTVEKVLRDFNTFEYIYDKENLMITTNQNTVFQLRALIKITKELQTSNIGFTIDEGYNILLNTD